MSFDTKDNDEISFARCGYLAFSIKQRLLSYSFITQSKRETKKNTHTNVVEMKQAHAYNTPYI